MMLDTDKLIEAIKEAATNIARSLTQELSRTDRQRVNLRASNILYHGDIPGSGVQILYTVPNATQTEITEIIIVNSQAPGSGSVVIQIFLVPPERRLSPGAIDVVIPITNVTPEDRVILTTNTAILTGWTIQAAGDVPSVTNLHISGVEKVK